MSNVNKGLFTSNSGEWETPQDFFDTLNAEFHFTLDPAATKENAKCDKYYTKETDGLQQDWSGNIVFVNPPYGRHIVDWVKKAYVQNRYNKCLIVMLLPARTDTKWFHDYVYGKSEIRFVKGRLKFGNGRSSAPFPSMVVVYR